MLRYSLLEVELRTCRESVVDPVLDGCDSDVYPASSIDGSGGNDVLNDVSGKAICWAWRDCAGDSKGVCRKKQDGYLPPR